MNRQEAIDFIHQTAQHLERLGEHNPAKALEIALETILPTPDSDTGLLPCGWCDPDHYLMRFNVQFWVRASTGKRKWMSVTQQYKKQVNYCPMCGRKLEVDDD